MSTKKSEYTVSCIYKLKNRYNGKIYIGQTKNLTRRIATHRYIMKHELCKSSGVKEYRLYTENLGYRFDDIFEVSIVEKLDTEDELNSREAYWIHYYNSMDPDIGYNSYPGGGVTRVISTDKSKYIRRQSAIYVYDTTNVTIENYVSCSEFGSKIDMLGENIADRARNAHMACNKRYYIIFADKDMRMKYLDRYFNKAYIKLINDITSINSGKTYVAKANVNSRINYLVSYLKVLRAVENVDSEESFDYSVIIEHLKSLKYEDSRKAHSEKMKAARASGVAITDAKHLGVSVITIDRYTLAVKQHFNIKDAAKTLGVSATKLKHGIANGRPVDNVYCYYADPIRRYEMLEKVWKSKHFKEYAKLYFSIDR